MKKFIIIATIGLMVIVALFENTGEDVPEETKADTKTEQTSEKDDNKSRSEMTEEDKAEAKQKYEEQKEKDEQVAKQKEKEEQAAKEEQEAKQKAEAEAQAAAEQKAKEEAEAQAKAEEAEKLRKENEAKEKAELEAAEQEDAETIYLQIMRDSVGTYVDIQFDKTEKTYVMTPTDQGLIDEISMLPMGIGHEDWGVLVDGMASMSKSGKDLVGEGYSINLVNPLNHENVILWIIDGEVIYNVIDDL